MRASTCSSTFAVAAECGAPSTRSGTPRASNARLCTCSREPVWAVPRDRVRCTDQTLRSVRLREAQRLLGDEVQNHLAAHGGDAEQPKGAPEVGEPVLARHAVAAVRL